ncbi:MAG TPA: NYN domain-containing protein [Coriobacteriia bacterium]
MPRHVIVDGYNLLMGSSRYAADAARDIDAARERLIADLGARAAEGERVTIVFDGASNPVSDGEARHVGGLTVIFSAAGTDADSVIEALASGARAAGEETEIVTSDAATRWTSVGGSVTVTRAAAFSKELDGDERAWREQHANGQGRSTVSDRLEGGVRSRLDRMAGRRKPSDG